MPLFPAVGNGPELKRVFGLPRRPIPDPTAPEALALAREVTARLRRVAVPHPFRRPDDFLYATQALALQELYETRGLLAPIRVGGGKSLLAYLAFAIMRPKRGMLIVPASMEKDTRVEWARFERDWKGMRLDEITLLSYEKIWNLSGGAKHLPDGTMIYDDIIARHAPDMVVMDECDKFGNSGATGCIRFGRYLEAHPETVVLGMSGTLIRRSLSDAAHIMEWCLGDQAPLPLEWDELAAWDDATRASAGKGKRTEYGALLKHLSHEERAAFEATEFPDDARGIVCGMLGRRILETRGVLGSQDGPLSIPARLDAFEVGAEDPAIEREYRLLLDGDPDTKRAAWSLPDGTLLTDARALARPMNTLGFGFLLQQDPKPPEGYRLASSAWAKEVRDVISYRPGLRLESEAMVRRAVEDGRLPELEGLLDAWRSARLAYTNATGLREPPSVPTWYSDEVVHEVRSWLSKEPGVVWVGYVALGERLSRELGVAYFGAGKTDAKGRHVTRLKKGEPAILSVSSVGRGTNGLQFCHHRNLWLTAPSEQPLARLHRPGQEADCVINDVYLGAGCHLSRFWKAHSLARNFAGAISKQAQKLEYFRCSIPRALPGVGRRWGATNVDSMDDAGEDC